MKTTAHFKEAIKTHLDKRAKADELFAASYAKEGKNLNDCVTYILNTVRDSGCNGFSDDEIFGMAVHYYDEDDLKVGKPVNCNVVVNHSIELSESEKEDARQKAIEKVTQDQIAALKAKPSQAKKGKTSTIELPSLF